MNSSFLTWGHFFVGVFSLIQTFLLVAQFGIPRDTIRFLGMLLSLSLGLSFFIPGLAIFGFFPVFYLNSLYGILVGVMAFSLPAFTYLGMVDKPTQIQRKIMWRFPILGGLIGNWLNLNFMLLLLVGGWLFAAGLIMSVGNKQRYALRLFFCQLILGLVYYEALQMDYWWLGLILSICWLVIFHRFISAYMVKNLCRKFAAVPVEGVLS